VPALEASDDDSVWVLAGMHHCVVTTIGRRSGRPHKVSVPYWLDVDGHRIVVASFAGAERHPAWYLNLTDRTANPTVRVRVQGGEFEARADILDGAEYDDIWSQLVADRPWYAGYQTRTERRIPLVRLVEVD
jgi:deazaflavin-dependent oxidoreductase (nitroreductase family)